MLRRSCRVRRTISEGYTSIFEAQDLKFSKKFESGHKMKFTRLLIISCLLLVGCEHKAKYNEFVRSITFSNLATFSYGGIVFEGLKLEADDQELLTKTSKKLCNYGDDESQFCANRGS